jgi:hypothetical protein
LGLPQKTFNIYPNLGIDGIKLPALAQHSYTHSLDTDRLRQLRQQLIPILRPFFAILLKLNNPITHQPIARSNVLVDGTHRIALQQIVRHLYVIGQLRKIHRLFLFGFAKI